MEVKGGKSYEKVLKDIAAKLKNGNLSLRVGFLERATYPDGTKVALVAAIQNYGAPARGIPPRPFFSNAVAENSPYWPAHLQKNLKDTKFDVDKSLGRMGELIKGQIQQSIIDTNDPPLSPKTIARKGSSKPLVDTGHMLNSVDYEIVKR